MLHIIENWVKVLIVLYLQILAVLGFGHVILGIDMVSECLKIMQNTQVQVLTEELSDFFWLKLLMVIAA